MSQDTSGNRINRLDAIESETPNFEGALQRCSNAVKETNELNKRNLDLFAKIRILIGKHSQETQSDENTHP